MIEGKNEKIAELEKELKVVDWYIEVLQEGVDTGNLHKEYLQAKEERDKARKEAESYRAKYINCKTKLQEKLKETQSYLRKCQEEVVKPLLQEVRIN